MQLLSDCNNSTVETYILLLAHVAAGAGLSLSTSAIAIAALAGNGEKNSIAKH